MNITKDEIEALDSSVLFAIGRAVDQALRDGICPQWHYSDYGDYETYDDMPPSLSEPCITAGKAALLCLANPKDMP